MRRPWPRFTIGWIMLVILLAGLASWLAIAGGRLRAIALAERQADARYQQAKLTREVAEFALEECVEGVARQEQATLEAERDLARADPDRDYDFADRSNMPIFGDRQSPRRSRRPSPSRFGDEEIVRVLIAEVEKARADERARLARYHAERANR